MYDEDYAEFQNNLILKPDMGDLISGSGGCERFVGRHKARVKEVER